MADLLRSGAAWLAGQLAASAGTVCAYKRGNNSSQFTAAIGRSMFESANSSGVIESWESRDYIVAVSALPYGEPQRGDVIVESLDGVSTFYEVATPRGVPLFHYGDAFRVTVRIHTKAIDRDVTFIIDDQGNEIVVPLAT